MNMQAIQGGTYEFQANPRVVQPRKKYREPQIEDDEERLNLNNLMFDKRVVRGNTYAAIVTSKNTETLKDASKFTKSLKRSQQPQQSMENQKDYEPGTPEPVIGRHHRDMQTEEFIETLTDKPPEQEKDAQTDFYIDRPIVRLFLPKKHGIDKEAQIYDGDLFDFDAEVDPILQVLIGKTLEASRMEVLEEEELKVMKEQQKKYEQLRNSELSEMQRLEAKEKRMYEESERRKLQNRKKSEQNQQSHQKLISRLIAKNVLSKLKNNVFNILGEQGIFRNPLEAGLYDKFLPFLYEEVGKELQKQNTIQEQLNGYLEDFVNENESVHQQSLQNEKNRREQDRLDKIQKQKDKEERKRQKEIQRLKQVELDRREVLKQKANDQLINKGELKQNVLAQIISDIEGTSQEVPTIGLFGGILGEVVLFTASLSQLTMSNDQYSHLDQFLQNSDNVYNIFKDLLLLVLKEGTIEIGVNTDCDQQIKDLSGVQIENWYQANEKTRDQVQQIIRENLSSLILNTIQNNAQELGVKEETLNKLINNFLKQVTTFDQATQSKIKFIKVNPNKQFSQQGLCYLQPDISSLPVHAKSQNLGKTQQAQDSDELVPFQPRNLAEGQLINQATLFNPNNDQLRVLVQHPVAEIILREAMIKFIATQAKQLEGSEFQLLFDSYEITRQAQTQVLEIIQKDYPVFDMSRY